MLISSLICVNYSTLVADVKLIIYGVVSWGTLRPPNRQPSVASNLQVVKSYLQKKAPTQSQIGEAKSGALNTFCLVMLLYLPCSPPQAFPLH